MIYKLRFDVYIRQFLVMDLVAFTNKIELVEVEP